MSEKVTGNAGFYNKHATLVIPLLDADVDSANDSGFSIPDDNQAEDLLEQDTSTGKILWADTGDPLVPMALRLSQNVTQTGDSSIPITIWYQNAVLRLWKTAARNPGDEIESGTPHNLGLNAGGTVTVYIEALQGWPDALPIDVSADVAGSNWTGVLEDTVHVIAKVPAVELVRLDAVAKELSPNELLQDDEAMFLLRRTGPLDADLQVYLEFSGTADREDYQLKAHGEIVAQSVWIPAGWESVEVTLTALCDDMTGPTETACVAIAPAADGSYTVGQNDSGFFALLDTSTWKEVATNNQKRPFVAPTNLSHPTAPTSGTGYTVVIVAGGTAEDGTSERDLWTTEATTAFPGGYVYNDVKTTAELVDVLGRFPAGSVSKLVISGHGTWADHVGVQPANNNTESPAEYGRIDDDTIAHLSPADLGVFKGSLAAGARVDVQTCGAARDDREDRGQELANLLERSVYFAVGGLRYWNQARPSDWEEGMITTEGHWVIKTPRSP